MSDKYIEEIAAFPIPPAAVQTAIPAFIGYTFKAERNGKSCIRVASRITSFAEYLECFGGGFKTQFTIETSNDQEKGIIFNAEGVKLCVRPIEPNWPRLYDSIRLFYANGGGTCYILPLGIYGDVISFSIDPKDFKSTADFPECPLGVLEKESEITLINVPDAVSLTKAEAYAFYQKVLSHCAKLQDRFAILDLLQPQNGQDSLDLFEDFRDGIGVDNLKYGAAYYPWLNTSVVQSNEIDFENFTETIDLTEILPETGIKEIIAAYQSDKASLQISMETAENDEKRFSKELQLNSLRRNIHNELRSSSLVYAQLIADIGKYLNQLPPGAAIAGIYTYVDSTRGVWKSPANVALASVANPIIAFSAEEQENMAFDITGKSINLIKDFAGAGTLIWGARTLDGISHDWRYINVCRTIIMIEQSVKLAVRSYIFEPNDANTWVTVKSMFSNFLFNLWKEGALAGTKPEEAFDVYIGLGSTMTPTDIVEGRMVISLKVALSKPAEFIILTFQQTQMQT